MRHKTLALLSALALGTALTACGGATNAPPEDSITLEDGTVVTIPADVDLLKWAPETFTKTQARAINNACFTARANGRKISDRVSALCRMVAWSDNFPKE